jgi:hypothetical protein
MDDHRHPRVRDLLLMLVSLARGEFLPHRAKSVLLVALALALMTFACLSFGQTTDGQQRGHRLAVQLLRVDRGHHAARAAAAAARPARLAAWPLGVTDGRRRFLSYAR